MPVRVGYIAPNLTLEMSIIWMLVLQESYCLDNKYMKWQWEAENHGQSKFIQECSFLLWPITDSTLMNSNRKATNLAWSDWTKAHSWIVPTALGSLIFKSIIFRKYSNNWKQKMKRKNVKKEKEKLQYQMKKWLEGTYRWLIVLELMMIMMYWSQWCSLCCFWRAVFIMIGNIKMIVSYINFLSIGQL